MNIRPFSARSSDADRVIMMPFRRGDGEYTMAALVSLSLYLCLIGLQETHVII
jgi:hypothetical protein